MRDKQRHVDHSASKQSRSMTIAFELQQISHEVAELEDEQREFAREHAYFAEVFNLAEQRLERQRETKKEAVRLFG